MTSQGEIKSSQEAGELIKRFKCADARSYEKVADRKRIAQLLEDSLEMYKIAINYIKQLGLQTDYINHLNKLKAEEEKQIKMKEEEKQREIKREQERQLEIEKERAKIRENNQRILLANEEKRQAELEEQKTNGYQSDSSEEELDESYVRHVVITKDMDRSTRRRLDKAKRRVNGKDISKPKNKHSEFYNQVMKCMVRDNISGTYFGNRYSDSD